MRKHALALLAVAAVFLGVAGVAQADGPSGSHECHIQDDDCDRRLNEDPPGDANGDGRLDDDGDGRNDEDPAGDAFNDPGENQVDCSESTSTNAGGLFFIHASSSGAELCADNASALPIDGRLIVTTQQGGYAGLDGDNTNPAPANGYVRVDSAGVHCGDEQNQDSTAGQGANAAQDCG